MVGGGVGWAGCGSSQFVGGLGGEVVLPFGPGFGGQFPRSAPKQSIGL